MAVMHMERFHICAMKRDRKKILEYLQQKGVVELKDVVVENDAVFSRDDTSHTRTLFDRNADTAVHAGEVLHKYAPQKKGMLSSLEGATPITPAQHDEFVARRDTVLHKAGQILKLDREIAENKAEAARFEVQQEQLQPWLKLPMSQNFQGTRTTSVFIGAIEEEHSLESLRSKLAEAAPDLDAVHIEIVSASPMQTCFYVIVLKRDAAVAEEALRSMGFARPPQATSRLPEAKVKRLEEKKEAALKAVKDAEEEIKSFDGLQKDLQLLEDHMKWRAEKYRAIEYLAQTKHTFVLDGYIPAELAPAVIAELESKFGCDAAVTPVGPDEDPPTLLKNNAFSRPVESVLESYSLPARGELDPTTIMSIFYYFMYGLMFSDAGYGAIMVIVCAVVLAKFKNMAQGMKMFFNMFFWCGISTVFWGIMFGSYFGDLITAFSGTFLGQEVLTKPLWLDPISQPMTVMMVCFLIGIIHLTIGYILKGIQGVKNGSPMDILYETIFPVGLAYGLILILMTTSIFDGLAGFTITLSPAANTACIVVALVCAVGMILFSGRESKNPGIRAMKGLYGVYNGIVGWISDILSYSRLLALGLATGVIASVMNQLGTLVGGGIGGGVVGIIAFIIVFIVGHLINFLINALGAYVHSNRLEFVEFFGKFYEGAGHRFAPLRMNTKHYKIEEETQNV